MIFISVDLPAPLTPSTPIFTPGRKDKGDALEDLAAAGEGLGQVLHHIDVLVAGHDPSLLYSNRVLKQDARSAERHAINNELAHLRHELSLKIVWTHPSLDPSLTHRDAAGELVIT